MTNNCMLTTIDNPFNPFEDFRSWFNFDNEKGYNCCSRLDRIAVIEDDMTEKERDEEYERAIDMIIETDFLGIFTKITKEIEDLSEDEAT